MAGRKTRSTNEILVDILNELAEHTDSEHGLTVKELSNRVGATEKTVHAHLQLLEAQRPMGRTVRRLTATDMRQADSADARPGWCMEPAIDVAELRLFGDGLALSRIDEEYARESYDRLRVLADSPAHIHRGCGTYGCPDRTIASSCRTSRISTRPSAGNAWCASGCAITRWMAV